MDEISNCTLDIEPEIAEISKICRKITQDHEYFQRSARVNWKEINEKLMNLLITPIDLDKTMCPKYNSILETFTELFECHLNEKSKVKRLEEVEKTQNLIIEQLKNMEKRGDSNKKLCDCRGTLETRGGKPDFSRSLNSFKKNPIANISEGLTQKNSAEIQEIFALLTAKTFSDAIVSIKTLQKVVVSIPMFENFIENICKEVFHEYSESKPYEFIEKLLPELKFTRLRLKNLSNFKGTIVNILNTPQSTDCILVWLI